MGLPFCYLFYIHQDWNPLEILNKIGMHENICLIIYISHFIVTYGNVVCCLDGCFYGCQDHIGHAFCHAPTTDVCLMFVKIVFHFQKI